jgi:hypothetical protein
MANAAELFPSEMTLTTALAIVIVIAALTVSLGVLGWLFTRLTPARRRDLVELLRAMCRGAAKP